MQNFRPANYFQISWTVGTDGACKHENFDLVMGPLMGGVRKRTVTCKACGRVEIQRPYKR